MAKDDHCTTTITSGDFEKCLGSVESGKTIGS